MAVTPFVDDEIAHLEREVTAAKEKLTEARRKLKPVEVQDYELKNSDGHPVRLSELFGDKSDLIVVHNMGTGCVYCTMWADGFIGLAPHLMDRAGFVLVSPDAPEVQKRFASKRNWTFPMASAHDSSFIRDMGFFAEEGSGACHTGPQPGVSTFKKTDDGRIFRVSRADFGPGDDFCALWPFLELLEGGTKGWEPKYAY